MRNSVIYIDGHRASVKFDPLIDMFRGEFQNTGHRAKFIAGDVKELKIAARDAHDSYCRNCQASGIKPFGKSKLLPLVCTLFSRIAN